MNVIFMICLMAIQAIRCDKAVSEQTNQIAHKNDTSVFHPYDFCKKFDCPSIDEPQCVRMRHYATGLSFYFIAMNKCEFKYLKCRNDVEGAIVPMKYCEHPAGQLAGKQTNETDKAHIRVKRRAHRARSSKPHLREAVKEQSNIKLLPQKQLLSKQNRRQAQRDFPMISAESINLPLVKVDMKQYEAACPTVCPSRDVMVCGISQHGIHRTFNSVCHMRMYGCKHPNEKMQLVSRRPCFMSSPFISEPGMQPRGRLTEPDDDDIVLRFIWCRDSGQLGKEEKIISPTDDGYTYIKSLNSYYKMHHKLNWAQAEKMCELENASIFYPENRPEATKVLEFWKNNSEGSTFIYIGIRRVNLTQEFVTIDGWPASQDNLNWRTEHEPGPPYRARCVMMNRNVKSTVINAEFFFWINSRRTYYDVICKRALPNNSDDGYTYIKSLNSSYKLHHNLTWEAAKKVCEKENARVFIPENEKEAKDVIAFWKGQGGKLSLIYTGIIRSESNPNEFVTLDGRSASDVYVDWLDEASLYHNFQDAVLMGIDGKYLVFHSDDIISVICKRKDNTSHNNLRDPRCHFKSAKKD